MFQSNVDFFLLSETLKEYLGIILSVKVSDYYENIARYCLVDSLSIQIVKKFAFNSLTWADVINNN